MAKKMNKTVITIAVIALLVIGYFVYQKMTPEIVTDVVAGTVIDGQCIGDGGQVSMCCYRENLITHEMEAVPCQSTTGTQAIFTYDSNDYFTDAVCFSITLANDAPGANAPLDFSILSATTVPSGGGDAAGAAEADDAWTVVTGLGQVDDVAVSASQVFSMNCDPNTGNLIRLSTTAANPLGAFTMTDGTYTTTLTAQAISPTNKVGTDNVQIVMAVEQETLGFSINVNLE